MVLFVAELSANHGNSLEQALETIRAFAKAGASAVKLQTYKPQTMTLNLQSNHFKVPLENKLWGGRTYYELYAEAMTPWEWHSELFQEIRSLGMIPFSSPFDQTAISFLEQLECPIYKIASFEITDIPLIRHAAATGKPLIISTGMATLSEIELAVNAARLEGCKDLTLLKTTSAYPASPMHSNIRTMPRLGEIFGTRVGLSDHTLGIGAALAAVSLGADVIEKHVILSRSLGGVDSSFSMEPDEFAQLVSESENLSASLGEVRFGPSEGDVGSLKFRRSILLVRDVKKGDKLSELNAGFLRPGLGISPSEWAKVEGLEFNQDYRIGDPVTWEMFK